MEHFDEYVDQTAVRSVQRQIPRPTYFPVDMVFGEAETLGRFPVGGMEPAVYPLRVYHATERVFVNAGREVNLGRLFDECVAIKDRIGPMLPAVVAGDTRGAQILFLK